MALFDKFKSFFSVINKHYPEGWVGNDFINRYYSSTHHRATVNGVIFMCDGRKYHGGLTDRLQGALSTYSIAKKKHLPFYINWVEPFYLSDYLTPRGVCDWRIEPSKISYNYFDSFPAIMSLQPTSQKVMNFLNEHIFKLWFRAPKKQTHVYTNLNFAKKEFPVLYNELFTPSKKLNDALKSHLKKLGSNYWSFSFRFNQLLGDFKDTIGTPLNINDAEKLIEKNIDELRKLLEMLPSGYKAFVACDSVTFLDRIKDIDPCIYFIPGKIAHIDQGTSDNDSDDIWLKTFVDQHIIMNAEKVYLLKTGDMYNSGFPRFAALIGGRDFIYHEF